YFNIKNICMKILDVFPHPEDESFRPAPALAAQLRPRHEVYLLTPTKGEATKQRLRLNISKKEMEDIRVHEVPWESKELGLAGMEVLNFTDSGLKELDPQTLETAIRGDIEQIKPDVLVTYAIHGISGFEDHLVSHAVVKSTYCDLKREGTEFPRRLAFFTRYSKDEGTGKFSLSSSKEEEIDCWVEANEQDYQKFLDALDCYETYQQVIEDSNVKEDTDNWVP